MAEGKPFLNPRPLCLRGIGLAIVATGSVALDTTRTPFGTAERVLGGAASYFSCSASFFTPVSVVSAVGGDFPQDYWDALERQGVDLSGVQRVPGEKSLFFDSTFDLDFHHRTANATELNILSKFEPRAPPSLRDAEFVYLGTLEPAKQLAFLRQFPKRRLAFMDTIDHYIEEQRDELWKTVHAVNGLVINDVELRKLTGTANLVKGAFNLLDHGPSLVLVKKGEHGSVLFTRMHGILPFPAFPLENIVDPTGAGDAFAGGFFGHIAAKGGKLSEQVLKEALVYANVMGSFACEEFSLNRLLNLSRQEIDERFALYRKMLLF